jgi:2-polyprenyl-3-methyl-5-hydroxy-6-metoxy-1,4-benzoquinol methylase
MAALDIKPPDQEKQTLAPSRLSDQVADAYYQTTAGRGHQSSRAYYENNANGLMRSLRGWLPTDKNARCLDLACGCGELLYLLERAGYRNTAGVDLCREELEEARRYVRGSLFQADVLEHLRTLESNSLDFLTALNFLEHVSKDKLLAVLKECRRVLRPGGTLAAMVPNAVSPFGSITRYWDITHEQAFTTNNFRQLAALVAFDTEVEFRECGPRIHGFVSALRYLLWQVLRAAIASWLMIEIATTKDWIYSMDMLVRLRVPSK